MTLTAESAVLVLLEQATGRFILTRRASHLLVHAGEICFPGGRHQAEDESLLATALRELEEELGIEPSRVHSIKPLQMETTLPGTTIQPWLGLIDRIEPYLINADEVSHLVFVDGEAVRNPANYRRIVLKKHQQVFTSLAFTASEHFIWGATARIMRQLSTDDGLTEPR